MDSRSVYESSPNQFPRLRLFALRLLGAALVGLAVNLPVAADPKSDFFQPDALRTGKALQKRTIDLNDPLGRDCPLPAGPLSLSAAVDLALCRNPATRSSWAAAHQQAAALGGAESALLPSLSATGSESRTYGTHVDVNGNTVSNSQDTRDAALTLTWTLYDFGGTYANIKGNRLLLDAAADTVNSVSQQTVLNVVQSLLRSSRCRCGRSCRKERGGRIMRAASRSRTRCKREA